MEQIVSQEQVPVEETPSPQPLTEERVQQMILEATTKAKDVGRREMQGIKDAEIARIQRAVRQDSAADAIKASLQNFDPEQGNINQTVELAELRYRDQSRLQVEAEEKQRQQQEVFVNQLKEQLTQEAKDLGVDPNDSRIDWAEDATDFITGRNRWSKSVSSIVGENRVKEKEALTNQFKELEANLRKDLGLDSVDTTNKGGFGVANNSDEAFIKEVADGSVDIRTKVNYDRAKKLGLVS